MAHDAERMAAVGHVMQPLHPRRKRIRLDAAAYADLGRVCSITIVVRDRRPVFVEPGLATAIIVVLCDHARRTKVRIHAYCVMPDHVHLVLGPSEHCDLVTFVGQFKNLAQRVAWSRGLDGTLWQRSFWDRFVRGEEHLRHVVEYVLDNPVRSGLVAARETYPFAGCPSIDDDTAT